MRTEQKWFIDDADIRLPELRDKEVDLVLTDPPYGVSLVKKAPSGQN